MLTILRLDIAREYIVSGPIWDSSRHLGLKYAPFAECLSAYRGTCGCSDNRANLMGLLSEVVHLWLPLRRLNCRPILGEEYSTRTTAPPDTSAETDTYYTTAMMTLQPLPAPPDPRIDELQVIFEVEGPR